mgnify:CR=1 FL=1
MYLPEQHKIWLATGESPIYLEPAMANRHGLIAGATGTGKTVTLKVLAESFSDMGVPVFLADIKGDLTGMCRPGVETKHIRRSIDNMGLGDFTYSAYTVRFFDVYGKLGHPVRTTITQMGPELLARLLDLNETQSGVLRIIFRVADDNGLLLLDLKDLRSMVQYVGDNAKDYKLTYGNISAQSVGAIQRSLLTLEDSLILRLIEKMGIDPGAFTNRVLGTVEGLTKVHGGDSRVYVGGEMNKALLGAEAEAKALGDEYVSVEHIYLALLEERGTPGSKIFAKHNITTNAFLDALSKVRGNQRVTSQNPEDNYEALTKYGRDLVEMAREGKLDPVIGRDAEIRHAVQILSRRTKNNPVLIGEPGVGKSALIEHLAYKICDIIITTKRTEFPQFFKFWIFRIYLFMYVQSEVHIL